MNALLFLALAAVTTAAADEQPDDKRLPSIRVPGVFGLSLGWRDPDVVTDAETGEKTVIRGKALGGTMVVREKLDRERLVFRINGVDVTDYAFSASTETSVEVFRDLVFELPEGRAFVELEVYASGEKEAVFVSAEDFNAPLPVLLAADSSEPGGPKLEKRTFRASDIPSELRDVTPTRYRKGGKEDGT